MLACRIALAGAMAVLAAPAAAFATNADGATPTATPLLVELGCGRARGRRAARPPPGRAGRPCRRVAGRGEPPAAPPRAVPAALTDTTRAG